MSKTPEPKNESTCETCACWSPDFDTRKKANCVFPKQASPGSTCTFWEPKEVIRGS